MTRRWPTAHGHRQSSRARPLGTREENSHSKKLVCFTQQLCRFRDHLDLVTARRGTRRFSVLVLKVKVLLKGSSEFCVWVLGLKKVKIWITLAVRAFSFAIVVVVIGYWKKTVGRGSEWKFARLNFFLSKAFVVRLSSRFSLDCLSRIGYEWQNIHRGLRIECIVVSMCFGFMIPIIQDFQASTKEHPSLL